MNNEISDTEKYVGNDIVFACIMIICGFLYWNLNPEQGAGVTIFAAVFCLATFFYLRAAGFRQTKMSLLCLLIIVMSALVFLLFDNFLVKGLNFLFLTVAVIYWISLFTGRNLEKRISVYILGDFCNQILVVPLRNFSCCFRALKRLFTRNQRGKTLIAVILGLLLILPILVKVILLLAEADAAFEGLMDHIQFTVSTKIMMQILFGIPVACYLYGLIYGDRYGRKTGIVTLESVDKRAASFRFIPGLTVYSALTALNLVFLIYFFSQITYLFSAFGGRLPELMTYAEYARRGFFELCTVAGINLFVIAVAHLLVKREQVKILRVETAVLCIFTMMLIVTALSKMIMYINYYGLTELRVYTSWFMILLLFIFAVIVVRQIKNFNAARMMVAGFVILFMILSYGNVDGIIAKYNIARYENGTLKDLDIHALSQLSDASVPYIYEAYQNTSDQNLKADLKNILVQSSSGEDSFIDPETFRDFNFQDRTADKIRNDI